MMEQFMDNIFQCMHSFVEMCIRDRRIALFLQAVENPYCFCIGGIGVKIEFAESGPSLQDTLTDFLLRQKSGL